MVNFLNVLFYKHHVVSATFTVHVLGGKFSVVMVEGTVPQHHRNGSLHKVHFLSFYLSMLTAKISLFSYSCRLTNEVQSETEYVLLLLSKVTQKHFCQLRQQKCNLQVQVLRPAGGFASAV
jgi:hypothetical protein